MKSWQRYLLYTVLLVLLVFAYTRVTREGFPDTIPPNSGAKCRKNLPSDADLFFNKNDGGCYNLVPPKQDGKCGRNDIRVNQECYHRKRNACGTGKIWDKSAQKCTN